MIHIRSLVQQHVDTATDIYNTKYSESRWKHDILDFDENCGVEIELPDCNDMSCVFLKVTPQEGYYSNQEFTFELSRSDYYPYTPPKCRLVTEIFHPNIDQEGHVCLNILREDWSPAIDFTQIACSLQYLLQQPNVEDPLNEEAALAFKSDPEKYQMVVFRFCYQTSDSYY